MNVRKTNENNGHTFVFVPDPLGLNGVGPGAGKTAQENMKT